MIFADARPWRNDGASFPVEYTSTPIREQGQVVGAVLTFRDITERKQAEMKLEAAHKGLVDASRQAGMAEVATSVLHNVGNVLNSVNVSATLLMEGAKKSRAVNLARAVALMQEHASQLGDFFTSHPKGKQILGYLAQLADHLTAEQAATQTEIQGLIKSVEHIKDIVAMQQNYAKVSGIAEPVQITELVEDALRMNAGALARHDVKLVREYHEPLPQLVLDKHKVLQILINLIRNAKYACDDSDQPDKRLTLRVGQSDARVRVSVIDNGVGIPTENLTRIFSHGFTTRKNGHGFGLHSGAIAAKELGGALLAHSDGPGKGAHFTLELPLS